MMSSESFDVINKRVVDIHVMVYPLNVMKETKIQLKQKGYNL